MKAMSIALLAILFAMISACAVIPQKQAVTDDGTPIYLTVDEEGNPKATLDPLAADGSPNEPLMEYDVDKVESLAKQAEDTGSKIPYLGWIFGPLLGAGGTILIGRLKKKNEERRKELGVDELGNE